MFHSTCTRRRRVDSRLLVVGSQTANLTPNLTPDPSFCHNLCCRYPNDQCEAIFDIYTSIDFQWYKKHLNAKCFDPCNRSLKFQESQRTPKSQFRECEFHPHISLKVGLRHLKQVTPNGWNACKVREGNMTMANPNYIVSLNASIITCDPYPSKIKRWWFCWKTSLGTNLQKKKPLIEHVCCYV